MECTAESSCENGGSQAQPTREEERGGQGLVWQTRLSRNKRASPDLMDKPRPTGLAAQSKSGCRYASLGPWVGPALQE